MKKLLILCLMACLLLVGCNPAADLSAESTLPGDATATPADPDDTEPTSPEEIHGPLPLPEIGEFSDVPGGILTLDDLKDIELMRIEAVDEYGFKYIYAWEYVFALDRFTMYFAEEVYDEQTIYVEKSGEADCYITSFNDTVFYPDPHADQLSYADDLGFFTNAVELFVRYSVAQENIRYKRIEDEQTPLGEAYAYEIYTGEEHTGYLLIDKATGLTISQTDCEKQPNYQVTKIDMLDSGIPDYK